MSWDLLQTTLQAMPETGPNGFEGVVATLLSELTGEQFWVARSGDQSGMDARNSIFKIFNSRTEPRVRFGKEGKRAEMSHQRSQGYATRKL